MYNQSPSHYQDRWADPDSGVLSPSPNPDDAETDAEDDDQPLGWKGWLKLIGLCLVVAVIWTIKVLLIISLVWFIICLFDCDDD